jgi:hypothetical protein
MDPCHSTTISQSYLTHPFRPTGAQAVAVGGGGQGQGQALPEGVG